MGVNKHLLMLFAEHCSMGKELESCAPAHSDFSLTYSLSAGMHF